MIFLKKSFSPSFFLFFFLFPSFFFSFSYISFLSLIYLFFFMLIVSVFNFSESVKFLLLTQENLYIFGEIAGLGRNMHLLEIAS